MCSGQSAQQFLVCLTQLNGLYWPVQDTTLWPIDPRSRITGLLSILWSSYRMSSRLPSERVTKSEHFQSVRGLGCLADPVLVLGFAVCPIPIPCVAQRTSEEFGGESYSSGYGEISPLCGSSHRSKVALLFWPPYAALPSIHPPTIRGMTN